MRKGFLYSLLFHATVLAVGYWGMPALRHLPPVMDAPIVVELVTIADETNAPPPKAEPKPEPEPAKAVPPPPPPEPPKAEAPPPPPPEPEMAALPPPPQAKPEPKPEPKPKPKPKPKAKPKPKPKPKAPPELANARPRHKPKPPDIFASVLKTVEDLSHAPTKPAKKTEKKKKKKDESFEAQVAKALQAQRRRHNPDRPLSISEIDLVRQQIARCWNLQAGAKEAENLVIEISVAMNPDGTVHHARIEDQGRMAGDPFFRAAAESALRAVLNPRCQPFKLPRDRYDRWQTMALRFDPKEMF